MENKIDAMVRIEDDTVIDIICLLDKIQSIAHLMLNVDRNDYWIIDDEFDDLIIDKMYRNFSEIITKATKEIMDKVDIPRIKCVEWGKPEHEEIEKLLTIKRKNPAAYQVIMLEIEEALKNLDN